MKYNGFGVLCAAYAFLNTVKSSAISPEMYELLSGVPFGLRHCKGDLYRVLEPLNEPCSRVEVTSGMLGYISQTHQFQDSLKAVHYILTLPVNMRVMIGPVDMGFLKHIPLQNYYKRQSHYFSVEKCEDNNIVVIDSEGTLSYKYGNDTLHEILNITSIPDSNGIINVWQFKKLESSLPKKNFNYAIIEIAAQNLQRAEAIGQGSQAILACADLLENENIKKWALKMCYEVNYLIQRKYLLSNQLLEHGANIQNNIIKQQLDILYIIRKAMMYKTEINLDLFKRLAEYENELTIRITQLTIQG